MRFYIFYLLALLTTLTVRVHSSSHSEAPGTANVPSSDPTDLYMFRSYEAGRQDFVTLIGNFNPLQDTFGGPNYYALNQDTSYEFNIDQDGNGVPDLQFQFLIHNELASDSGLTLNVGGKSVPIALKTLGPISAADDPNLNFFEFYRLNVISNPTSSRAKTQAVTKISSNDNTFQKPFDYAGTKTFSNYFAYTTQFVFNINIPDCGTGRVFVGQRQEGFAINLGPIFDLINFIPIDFTGFPNGIKQSPNNNQLRGKAITSLALEVPTSCLVGDGNGVIGGWISTSERRTGSRIARLGNPLVNELLIGLVDKDKWNRAAVTDSSFDVYIENPTLPSIIGVLFTTPVNQVLGLNLTTIAPTNFPRNDLVATFLTGIPAVNQQRRTTRADQLRLNTAIPPTAFGRQSSLGVLGNDTAGFPNGRRPGDDTVDIGLRALMGVLCHLPGAPFCSPSQAPVGTAPITDGAPVADTDFLSVFPYLNIPVPGSAALTCVAGFVPGFTNVN